MVPPFVWLLCAYGPSVRIAPPPAVPLIHPHARLSHHLNTSPPSTHTPHTPYTRRRHAPLHETPYLHYTGASHTPTQVTAFVASFLVFHDRFTPFSLAGIIITILGGIWYSKEQMDAKKASDPKQPNEKSKLIEEGKASSPAAA